MEELDLIVVCVVDWVEFYIVGEVLVVELEESCFFVLCILWWGYWVFWRW